MEPRSIGARTARSQRAILAACAVLAAAAALGSFYALEFAAAPERTVLDLDPTLPEAERGKPTVAELTDSPEPAGRARQEWIAPEQIEVHVLDTAGAPMRDAKLVLFRGEHVLGQVEVDSEGVARFTARSGSAEYVVILPGWELQSGSLELAAGTATIVVDPGAVLAGKVLVDGKAPQRTIELSWVTQEPNANQNSLPVPVAQAVLLARGNDRGLVVNSDAYGDFAIRGLAPGAAGSIHCNGRKVFIPGPPKEFPVTAPQTELVLELSRRRPMLR